MSFEAIQDEKEKHIEKANWARAELEKVKGDLEKVFIDKDEVTRKLKQTRGKKEDRGPGAPLWGRGCL